MKKLFMASLLLLSSFVFSQKTKLPTNDDVNIFSKIASESTLFSNKEKDSTLIDSAKSDTKKKPFSVQNKVLKRKKNLNKTVKK